MEGQLRYQSPNRWLTRLGWAILFIVTVVGLAAVVIRTVEGLGVTNLNYIVPWGLWVAFYIYFIGLSAGSFLLSTAIYVFGYKKLEPIGRLALFSALIALIAGLFFVLIDLGHMERFWTVFVNRNWWSVLEIEIHFYVLYIIVILAELWLLMRQDLIRCAQNESGWRATICGWLTLGSRDLSEASAQRDRRWMKILGIFGIPIAIGVHGGTGALFAVVKARPMWYGPLFPIVFIISALASGAALLTFLLAFFVGRALDKAQRDELVLTLGKITAGLLIFDLLLIWSEFSVGLYGNIPEDVEVLRLIMFGPFWWVFWLVQILFGALVPLFFILWPRTGRDPRMVGLAGLMIVIGIIGVRLNIVIPALNVPVLPGFDRAYTMLPAPTQTTATLSPEQLNLLTWLILIAAVITVGVIAALAWLHREGRHDHPLREGLVAGGVAALFFLVLLVLVRWLGSGTALGLSTADLTHTPISGILGHSEIRSYYVPTLNEWLSSLGLIGLAIFLGVIGYNILPLETSEGH